MDKLLALFLTNPEAAMMAVKGYIGKYKPMVYELAKEVANVYTDYAGNKDVPLATATLRKNFFDAYVQVGFTEDQALALVLNDNIQLMKNLQNAAGSNTTSKNG